VSDQDGGPNGGPGVRPDVRDGDRPGPGGVRPDGTRSPGHGPRGHAPGQRRPGHRVSFSTAPSLGTRPVPAGPSVHRHRTDAVVCLGSVVGPSARSDSATWLASRPGRSGLVVWADGSTTTVHDGAPLLPTAS
jgi:hypothetical protein